MFGILLRDPNVFLSRLVTMEETSLHHYDTDSETKQQWMELRLSGSPRPKYPSAKIRWKISRLIFFCIKTVLFNWLSSKGPNFQRGVLLIFAGAIEGYFEGKTTREAHQVGIVLTRRCPDFPGTCNTEETGLPGIPVS